MKPIDLMDAIGNLPKDLIEFYADEERNAAAASNVNIPLLRQIWQKQPWVLVSASAACIVILFLTGIFPMLNRSQPDRVEIVQTDSSAVTTNATDALEKTVSNTTESDNAFIGFSHTESTKMTYLSSTLLKTETTAVPDSAVSTSESFQTGAHTTVFSVTASESHSTVSQCTTTEKQSSTGALQSETEITTSQNAEMTTAMTDPVGLSEVLPVKRNLLDSQQTASPSEFRYTVTVCDADLTALNSGQMPDGLKDADLRQYRCVILDTFGPDSMLWSAYVSDGKLCLSMTYGDSIKNTELRHIRYVILLQKQIVSDADDCRVEALYTPGYHASYNGYNSYEIPFGTDG